MPSPSPFHVTHLQPKTLYLMSEPGRRSKFDDLEPLKRSILSDGLKTPLRVRLVTENRYKIIHGRRRYMAIMALIGEGHKDRFRYVPCNIARGGDAIADSVEYLACNMGGGLDQALVDDLVRSLFDAGLSREEISLRTGMPKELVAKPGSDKGKPGSLVSRFLTKGTRDLPSFARGEQTSSVDDLLAAVCASAGTDANKRQRAIRIVNAMEDYLAGRIPVNQAAKIVTESLTNGGK